VTSKLYKAAEVCELVQVQPYVLRSWEKEFPGIGVQKSPESPRLYRQSDVEHVQRIKQLVFGEGLTVAGARRRLEETASIVMAVTESEAAEVFEALGDDVRGRIAFVRDRLRELQSMLTHAPGASNGNRATAKPRRRAAAASKRRSAKPSRPKARNASARRTASARRNTSARSSASRAKPVKRTSVKSASAARKKATPKRKHARA
jgi:DNA-binding transcriptional MerR regulator